MHRILAIYGPQADPERFRAHYLSTHLGLAAKLPGLRAMHYSFEVQALIPGEEFFCVWTGEFDDAAAADAALGSLEGEALSADIPNYVSGDFRLVRYTDGDILHD